MMDSNKNQKTILISVVTSVIVFFLLLAITGYLFIQNQKRIFDYLVSRAVSEEYNVPGRNSYPLFGEELAIIEAVREAKPAVISIVVAKDVPVIEKYYEEYSPFDLFGELFPFELKIPQYRERGTERREVGGGTAFLISPDGLAITNRHVVSDDKATYTAFTNEGKKYEIEVLAKDEVFDIALLKLKEGKDFKYLSFADSNQLAVGQTAIAIGNALGEFRNTVSVGVVSGLARSLVAGDLSGQREFLDQVIQTDAAINPGNSGGPLLNSRGEVMGVNVALAVGSENIGFAVPSNFAKSVVDSWQKYGKIVRAFLGIRYMTITPALQEEKNLPVDYGILITAGDTEEEKAVVPDSPAEKAGLKEGDIILEMDGQNIKETSFASLIRQKDVGDKVTLKVLREGKELSVKATLVEMK